jgi:hypothetical protein
LRTPFERQNHIKESDLALRYYLTTMSDRLRFHPRPFANVGNSLAKLNFRLIAQT